jgi:hypothetical protein
MLGLRDEELGKLHQGIMLSNHLPQAVVPPIRERLGDHNRLQIPLTYPGKRDHSWKPDGWEQRKTGEYVASYSARHF